MDISIPPVMSGGQNILHSSTTCKRETTFFQHAKKDLTNSFHLIIFAYNNISINSLFNKWSEKLTKTAACFCLDPEDIRQFIAAFKALSDETRQKILLMLEEKERSVGEIVDAFDLSQPTISRHLAVLKHVGLVEDRRQGQQVYYHLRPHVLVKCCRDFFRNFSCCGDMFKEVQTDEGQGT